LLPVLDAFSQHALVSSLAATPTAPILPLYRFVSVSEGVIGSGEVPASCSTDTVLTSNTSSRDSSYNSAIGSARPNALSRVIQSPFDDGCPPFAHKAESSDDESIMDDESVLDKSDDDDAPSEYAPTPSDIVHAAAHSTTSRGNVPTTTAPDPEAPIRVSPKPPKGRKRKNVFIDDRGFPDQSDEFDTLLHSLDGGPMLRKRRHPAPAFDDIDPAFNFAFDEALHGAQFQEEFTPSPLLSDEENKELEELIKRYWCVFDHRGLFVPVKDYECHINTGTARPIAVKGINYGPYETPIMRKCIAKLEQLGHISQISEGPGCLKHF
jgi:hypothetical protein